MHRWDLAAGEPLGEPIAAAIWPRIIATIPDADGSAQAAIWHVDHDRRESVGVWRVEDKQQVVIPGISDDTIAVIRCGSGLVAVAGSPTGAVSVTPL